MCSIGILDILYPRGSGEDDPQSLVMTLQLYFAALFVFEKIKLVKSRLDRRFRWAYLDKVYNLVFMKIASIKHILDLLVYFVLVIWAIVSFSKRIDLDHVIRWQHHLGVFFLMSNGLIFYYRHQIGILFLGLTLILGVIGILSFNVALVISYLVWTPFNVKIPIFYGNPAVFGLLILHFILSGRYYVDILTRQYWEALMKSRTAE